MRSLKGRTAGGGGAGTRAPLLFERFFTRFCSPAA
jgi:hypothetical protein